MKNSDSCKSEAAYDKDELGAFIRSCKAAHATKVGGRPPKLFFVKIRSLGSAFTATDGVTERACRAVASKRASDSEGSACLLWVPARQSALSVAAVQLTQASSAALAPCVQLDRWIRKLAFVDRKTSASDASGEPCSETLELSDPLIDPFRPLARETRPIPSRRDTISRKLGEFRADFIERQPNSLREDDKCDPAQHRARVAAMPGARSLRAYEPSLLVKAQSR